MTSLSDLEARRLAQRLRTAMRQQRLTQMELAARCQVDQSLVSRVLNEKLVRRSKGVRRLEAYLQFPGEAVVTPEITGELKAYFAAGGEPIVLRDALRVLTRASRRLIS